MTAFVGTSASFTNDICLRCRRPFAGGQTPNGGFTSEVRCYEEGRGPYHFDCMNDCKAAIASELYKALERLEAPPDLLSIIGSYGDTLSDEEVLQLLRDWNATGKVIHTPQ